jgi:hypothetical protein
MSTNLFKVSLFAIVILTLQGISCAAAETISQLNSPVPSLPFKASCEEFLKRNDIEDVHDCNVSGSGTFGNLDDRLYYYVLYCIIPEYSSEVAKCGDESFSANYYNARGLGIFVQGGSSKQAQLFLERGTDDIGLYIYEKPRIVQNSYGTFLHVPIRFDGTGFFNDSEYYVWDRNSREWKLLDSKSWTEELNKRLPAGLSINTGIWPNLQTMTAESHLYREDDANASPSGGTAIVKLTLQGRRFTIKSVEFKHDERKE